MLRAWYEDWQMECCGTPFSVGDEISWKLETMDGDHVARGGWQDEQRTYGALSWVENHGGPPQPTKGLVRAIDLVSRVYTRRAAGELEPVPGTRTLEPRDNCPKWFGPEEPCAGTGTREGAHDRRHRRIEGVLVTLEVPNGTPTEPRERS